MELGLTQLYMQKGVIITEMEMLEGQLKMINQKIFQSKNIEIKQQQKVVKKENQDIDKE